MTCLHVEQDERLQEIEDRIDALENADLDEDLQQPRGWDFGYSYKPGEIYAAPSWHGHLSSYWTPPGLGYMIAVPWDFHRTWTVDQLGVHPEAVQEGQVIHLGIYDSKGPRGAYPHKRLLYLTQGGFHQGGSYWSQDYTFQPGLYWFVYMLTGGPNSRYRQAHGWDGSGGTWGPWRHVGMPSPTEGSGNMLVAENQTVMSDPLQYYLVPTFNSAHPGIPTVRIKNPQP